MLLRLNGAIVRCRDSTVLQRMAVSDGMRSLRLLDLQLKESQSG